ncbi:hypothetical protein [Natronorarus salvus]|uniref:hypothetical protein n=1 Tax=Natronorarus salvus TaxID=3117733 RepID=UPI002F26D7E2
MNNQTIDSHPRESKISSNGTEPESTGLGSSDWKIRFVDIDGTEGRITNSKTVIYDGAYRDEVRSFLNEKRGSYLSDTDQSHLLIDLYASLPLKEIEAQQTTVEEH